MHFILEEIAKIPYVQTTDLEELFQFNSQIALDCCRIRTIEKEKRFVTSGEEISTIWILLSGEVKALEEYSTGQIYTFQKFSAPEVFGEMEALSDITKFRATLITETECVFLTLPIKIYSDFLKKNSQYLYKRTKIILKRILDERKAQRIYLMMKAIDRIKIYFIQKYPLKSDQGISIFKLTRHQLSEETGYSIKTINRVIKQLKEENLLHLEGHKIIMTEKQYQNMTKSVDEFANHELLSFVERKDIK